MKEENTYGGLRKIIHVDMDAFFASVEQRDRPDLKGLPVAVGGSPSGRGVIAAASYEARRFGVRSAMPSARAVRLCPDLVFVKPRFDRYKEASEVIRCVFFEYTDLVEPLSLDEAYLDVTENHFGIRSAREVALQIKSKIRERTGLTASAGIATNKFLAKMASDLDKPDGLSVITPEKAPEFLKQLQIGRFHGIGKATEQRLVLLGIETGEDLLKWSEVDLAKEFGKAGHHYYRIVRGLDERPVSPDRVRKSIGKERTFSEDLSDPDEMIEILDTLALEVLSVLVRLERAAKTVTLKVRYSDFETITRSRSLAQWIHAEEDLEVMKGVIRELFEETEAGDRNVRLLGVTLSGLNREGEEWEQLGFAFR
jgi:DNA polymerase-4